MDNKYRLIIALASLSLVPQASAIIVGGEVTGGSSQTKGGIFLELTPPLANPFGTPNSVGENTFNDNNLYGFNEDQNVNVETDPLALDIGSVNPLPVGTEVASHYIFFDPAGTESQIGYVDFDAPIFGIITSSSLLGASDYLANTGVTYLEPGLRGLEGGDSVWIDPLNPFRMMVDWDASTPGDYVRVLTQHSPGAVPEGGLTLGMLALAIPAMIGFGRKFRRA